MHILQIFYRYSKNIYLHDVVYILHKYSTSIDILQIYIFTMWNAYSTKSDESTF